MQLEDRYYTSTEVADILGVSLRSVYRYMEDGKLEAEIKTATGRHRFTRNDILNFLYPDRDKSILYEDEEKEERKEEKKVPVKQEQDQPQQTLKQEEKTEVKQETDTESEEEPVDWLAKFREAAAKYREEQEVVQPQAQPQIPPQPAQETQPQPQAQPQPAVSQVAATPQPQVQPAASSGPTMMYYRSMLGGLKDIAQTLDKSARNSNLEYAFTLSAGASLHKPIKPFATLHAYIKPSDRDFFEKLLRLTSANQANAQLCLILSNDNSVFNSREEVHGLYVVSKDQLKKDISTFGDAQLAQEMADIL